MSCWLYAGYINTNGYGKILANSTAYYAHRIMYENVIGEIPQGLQIDHLCRVRACINPEHLQAVTRHENILRGTAHSAINARKTHCKRGHEFTQENTYSNNGRWCKTCKRLRRKGQL